MVAASTLLGKPGTMARMVVPPTRRRQRQGVGLERFGAERESIDVADGFEEISPLGLREFWPTALHALDHGVGPEQHVDRPQPGRLLEQPHLGGPQIVETPAD